MKAAEVNPKAELSIGRETRFEARSTLSESVRDLSIQNRNAKDSPAAVDTAPFDKDRLREALKAADRLSEYSNRRLKFEYQEEADLFQVSVVDGEGEVIRQIPADGILRMIENLKRYTGVSVDTKA